ncbi:MAG: FG-GAP repeat protein [Armatimonadetes bacterium]|nr:FG-GAP repeat protein [Armatimonadota bacterium]
MSLISIPAAQAGAAGVKVAPPFLWASGFGAAPRYPLAGDVNADRFSDLLCVYPPDKSIIDYALNGRGEKPLFGGQARTEFGQDCRAAASGEFAGTPGADVVGVFADGSIRVAHSFADNRYTKDDLAASLNRKLDDPVLCASGDFDGDGKADAALYTGDTGLTLLWNESKGEEARFRVQKIAIKNQAVRILAGDFDGDSRAKLVWQTPQGLLYAAGVSENGLAAPRKIMRASVTDSICTGDFDGDKKADIVIGTRMLPGGDSRKAVPWPELGSPRGGSIYVSGDINGDDKADLLRYCRTQEKFKGDDVLVYLTYEEGSADPDSDGLADEEEKKAGTDPLRRDTDADGLLDGWEVKGAYGLNLPNMGCSPLHKDVLVQAQRWDNVDEAAWNKEFEKAVKFYADLPISNPDGKTGLALHAIPSQPIPKAKGEGRHWGDVGSEFFPKEYRGLGHWMQITSGGGGQAGQMADMGSCGAGYAVFIHEFGHQLGLDHTGYWGPAWCPIYTSLMNYAYSYSFDGKGELIHYAHGDLTKLTLKETHLSEKLPLPMEKVKFLGNPPYRYRLKAAGKETLIDWNWNGIFGEEGIRADINYGYSTTGGIRQNVDKTHCAPYLLSHRGRKLLLFSGQFVSEPPKAAGDETKKEPVSLCASRPGRLLMRAYRGRQIWGDPLVIDEGGLAGDPVAVSHRNEVWVFYPSLEGVRYRRLWERRDGKGWEVSPSSSVPDTKEMQPAIVSYKGKMVLFLWPGPKADVTYRIVDSNGTGPARSAGFASTFAPGLGVDSIRGHLLIGSGQDQDKNRPSRWQIRRWAWNKESGSLREIEKKWVEGEKGGDRGTHRPNIVFERTPDAGPEGRIHFIAGGMTSEQVPWTCFFDAMQVADKTVQDGWITKRYYDEWSQSRSTPGAAWFGNDIIVAYRWVGGDADNTIHVGYHGLGIESEPMGSLDDVAFIADLGCERSILSLGAMPPEKKQAAVGQ